MPDDPDARLHDAVMSAVARDHTFHETGRWRDNLRAMLAVVKVGWRLRRAEKDRSTSDMSEEGSLYGARTIRRRQWPGAPCAKCRAACGTGRTTGCNPSQAGY